jgi:YfiR/HmsC-like
VEVLTAMATKQYSEALPRTRRLCERPLLMVVILAMLVSAYLGTAPKGYAQDPPPDYQIKAAYLFNFIKYVDWPEEAFADPLSPIVIGIVGDDPFGSALPQVVVGKTVQGRDLVIRKYRAGEDLRSSQILFISASEKKRIPQLLASLLGSSTLTVADINGFLEEGGMIELFSEGNRVRFSIDLDATIRAKLKISAKLLNLARIAGHSGKEGGS